MSDVELRELERRAEAGDREAAADLFYMRARIGVSNRTVTYPLKPPFRTSAVIREDSSGHDILCVAVNSEDPRFPAFQISAECVRAKDKEWFRSIMEDEVARLLNRSYAEFARTHVAALKAVLHI